jgi:hypothetical protein
MVTMAMQEPRICSLPPADSSLGSEAYEFCQEIGLVLDDWQAYALEGALGRKEDGSWAAFEVGVNVSRQNGKGGILEARDLAGVFLIGERLIIHSSHEFATSMEAFLRMEAILEESGLYKELRPRSGVSRSHGSEGFFFKSGQRIRYRTRTKGGGRGFSSDCLILDEAMFLPEMAIGALLPTLSARPNPQVWYTGSAVDQQVHEDGLVFARIRERGLKGDDPSLAYFEWSADQPEDKELWTPEQVDDELAADPAVWVQANPALGIRISEEHVENERRSMDPRTFAVERLGIGDWPATTGKVDVLEGWDELADPSSVVLDPVCFAFDVAPDRSSASISAAGKRPDGLAHVEVVENRRGTGWLVDRLVEVTGSHSPLAVLCDGIGPASSLVPELENRGVKVEPVNAREHANACGLIFDLVDQEKLRHLGTKEMKDALKGAVTRPLGDAWAWSRKNSTIDISPLVASTLALWGSAKHPETGEYLPDLAELLDE